MGKISDISLRKALPLLEQIYPSEFGKQRLAEEEVRGPQELIEDKLDESDEEDGSGDDEEGRRFNMEKLRKYQLNRLK